MNERIVFRHFKPGDEIKINKLFNQTFNLKRSIDEWRWKFYENIQENAWISIAEDHNEIVAQYCMIPNYLNYFGSVINSSQSCDTMVRYDYRRKKIFELLAKYNYQDATEKGVRAVFGFPNRYSYQGLVKKLGWKKIVLMKYYYRRIGFAKAIGNKFDSIQKCLNQLLYRKKIMSMIKGNEYKVEVDVCSKITKNMEKVLEENRKREKVSLWKDTKYLRWRYEQHPTHEYIFHKLLVQGEITGFIVCRRKDSNVAICDMIHKYKDPYESSYLLMEILNFYSKTEAQKIEFFGYDNGYYDRVFQLCGFKKRDSQAFILCVKTLGDNAFSEDFFAPKNWTIAYGDTDII